MRDLPACKHRLSAAFTACQHPLPLSGLAYLLCLFVRLSVCRYVLARTRTSTHTHTHTHNTRTTHAHARMDTHTHARMELDPHIHTRTHRHTHTHAHTHTHTHTDTYYPSRLQGSNTMHTDERIYIYILDVLRPARREVLHQGETTCISATRTNSDSPLKFNTHSPVENWINLEKIKLNEPGKQKLGENALELRCGLF